MRKALSKIIVVFSYFSVAKASAPVAVDFSQDALGATDGAEFIKRILRGEKVTGKPGLVMFTAPYRLCAGECNGKEKSNFVMQFPMYIGKKAKDMYKTMYPRDHSRISHMPNIPFKTTTIKPSTTPCVKVNMKIEYNIKVLKMATDSPPKPKTSYQIPEPETVPPTQTSTELSTDPSTGVTTESESENPVDLPPESPTESTTAPHTEQPEETKTPTNPQSYIEYEIPNTIQVPERKMETEITTTTMTTTTIVPTTATTSSSTTPVICPVMTCPPEDPCPKIPEGFCLKKISPTSTPLGVAKNLKLTSGVFDITQGFRRRMPVFSLVWEYVVSTTTERINYQDYGNYDRR